jgi:hypothetical protein
MTNTAKYSRTRLYILIVPLLLAMWLIPLLSVHRPAQYDEAFTYLRYAQSPLLALFAYELPNNHLLHSFGVWLMTSVMGDSLLAIRFVSIAASLLCAAQLIRLTARVSNLSAGLLAAALLMIVPLWGEMVANARGYTLSAFLTLVFIEMIYFSGIALSRGQTRALMGICVMLMLTLPSMGLLIAAGCVWIVWHAWNSRYRTVILKSYLPPMIGGTLIGGLFYTTVFIYGDASSHATTFGEESLIALINAWFVQVFNSLPAIVLAIGVIFGLIVLWRSQRRMLVLFGAVLGVALSLSFVQEIVTGKVFFARNFYYLIPLTTLMSGVGLAAVLRAKPALVGTAVFVCLLFGINLFQTLNAPTEASQLAASIETNSEAGDVLQIGCCLDFPVYYSYRDTLDLFLYTPETRRIVFVPTQYATLDEMLVYHHRQNGIAIALETCIKTEWGRTEVAICPNPVN